MTLLESLLLGAIQGVFMFVPVSSTSHLVMTQHWLLSRGSQMPAPESPEMIAFDLLVHVGTMVSVVVVFRGSLMVYLQRLAAEGVQIRAGTLPFARSVGWRYLALGLLAVAATGVVGLPLKGMFEAVFAQPLVLSFTLAVTGVFLWISDRLKPRRGLKQFTAGMAIAVGLAQAVALLPGISRSGITIVAGLAGGLKRRWAAEFSFFIAIPTILGASLLQLIEVHRTIGLGALEWGPLLVGFVTAAVVGSVALSVVVRLLRRARWRYFAYYVWTLAVLLGVATWQGWL